MKHKYLLRSTALASAMVLTSTYGAFAQEDGSRPGIEEIVITSEKRESSVQDTAIAISAFDDSMLDDLGIQGASDIADFTPGMSYNSGTYSNRINIRGIGRVTNELGADPGVAVYVDGIYTSETAPIGTPAVNVDRIEVLRGPQGTLYGRNAMGGAVNIISKRPSNEFEGELRLKIGNYGLAEETLVLSGPITDKLRYRVLGTKTDQDGWMKNLSGDDIADTDSGYIEAQLEYDPTDRLNIWIKYQGATWNHLSNVAWPGLFIDDYDTNSLTYGSLNANPWIGWTEPNPTASDIHTVDYDYTGYLRLDNNHQTTAHITYDFDNVSVKYVGGYSQYDWSTSVDWDASSNPDAMYVVDIKEHKDWTSHELTFASTTDSEVQWILGAYYYKEIIWQPFSQKDPDFGLVTAPYLDGYGGFAYMGQGDVINPDGIVYYQEGKLNSEAWAIFGQVDYDINERWHVSAGLRHSNDKKEGYEANLWNYCCFAGNYLHYDNGDHSQSDSWSSTTWRVEADYLIDDDQLIYGWVGTGYKSGGFKLGNNFFNLSGGALPEDVVQPEDVLAYEVGYKGTINDVFRLNAAAYSYQYNDLQVPTAVFVSGIRHTIFVNVDEAESKGLELEALWLATEGLTLTGVFSFQDTELVEQGTQPVADICGRTTLHDQTDPDYFVHAPGSPPPGDGTAVEDCAFTQDINGNELIMSPKTKLTVNATYEWDLQSGLWALGATYTFTDSQFYSIFNDRAREIDAWNKVDLRASWIHPDGNLRIIAFMKNALNEDYFSSMTRTDAVHGNMRIAVPQPPRMYGLEAHINF